MTFPSSYIKTEGTQVTRAVDNCSRTLGQEFNASEFTLTTELTPNFQPIAKHGDLSQMLFVTLSGGSTDNRVQLGVTSSTRSDKWVGVTVFASGDNSRSYNDAPDIWMSGETKKLAVSVSPEAVKFVVDGVVVYTAGAGPVPVGLSALYVGSDYSGTQKGQTITCGGARIFPRALSEAELIALTTTEA